VGSSPDDAQQRSAERETIDAPRATARPTVGKSASSTEDLAAAQLRFRRALTAAYAMWSAFLVIDFVVVRNLDAGRLLNFVIVRVLVIAVAMPILVRLYRKPPPSERLLMVLDLSGYTSAALAIALMCLEFRGIASPYASGLCLVLLARMVTAQDPWRRGLVRSGIPVAVYYATLLGAALFSPRVAAQLHDPAALTMLLLNSAYILGTYVFLVVGGNVIWSLRRQIFEARALGRYRLKRRIASGGMGDVWVAYHPGLERDVAVKILRPDAQERSTGAVARFEREVRATVGLEHPNTVRVFDYGTTEDGLWYYVMELLSGETLADHVERLGPMPPARAIHVIGQAARALGEAHNLGIVHRDVKPENLFLTSLGGEHDFVKVLDFGIAKLTAIDSQVTQTGWVLGTPAYMSPEVAMGKEADARSDVYALGAVLYFLLCGFPPFERENASAVVFAHINDAPKAPSRVAGRPIPVDLEGFVMRALSKDPSKRFDNASEMALALAECRLAGKWTFGDATYVAKRSSRPPPSGGIESIVIARAPRLPQVGAFEHAKKRTGNTPPA
jgi:eukaryotic-like serine/threonine-protein kinase